MKKTLVLALMTMLAAHMPALSAIPAIDSLLCRILAPADAGRISYSLCADGGGADRYTISCDGATARVEGNSTPAIAAGINELLGKCGISPSWNDMRGSLPSELPVLASESHSAAVPMRYYLNFCTHSYSMAFWDWERWEREIDWMALHGINMPLVTEGFECVWKDMLQTGYGYRGIDGVSSFVPGPAYMAWFYMNNLTGHGGPLPESWYTARLELARRIFRRMAEYGMTPVVPGYSGMIPGDFLSYADSAATSLWGEGAIAPGGKWCGFERPALVVSDTCLREASERYYAAIDRLFGDVLETPYFAIDPFHEGGRAPEGLDCGRMVRTMWDCLRKHRDDAVWVVQHWQDNPKEFVTHNIPRGRLVILDLHGDALGDSVCSGHSTDADGRPHQWIYCMLNNYGGNVGLFGRTERVLGSAAKALGSADENGLAGIGTISEGIENNPMLFDMVYSLPFSNMPMSVGEWCARYAGSRYGLRDSSPAHRTMTAIWHTIATGIYRCEASDQQGATESVLMMRPAAAPAAVSAWANPTWYWSRDSLRAAAHRMLSLAPELRDNANYRYDLVDIVRQCVADRAYELLGDFGEANTDEGRGIAEGFLSLIMMQDRLLGSIPDFRLGTWTEQARRLGTTPAESDLYEINARMLITTWGMRHQADKGMLRDYGNREWNGLLGAYYYPRWRHWFERRLAGDSGSIDWYGEFEQPFTEGRTAPLGAFTATAEGDPVELAAEALETLEKL